MNHYRPARVTTQSGFFDLGMGATAIVFVALLAIGAAMTWAYAVPKIRAAEAVAGKAIADVKAERELRAALDAQAVKTNKELRLQKEKADVLQGKLRAALAATPDCRLAGAVGGVLRDIGREPGNTGPEPDASGAVRAPGATVAGGVGDSGQDGSVSCKAIAEWAERNIQVSERNRIKGEGIRDAYDIARTKTSPSAPGTP